MIPAVVDALAKISWVPKQNFSLPWSEREKHASGRDSEHVKRARSL
jgi:hypothetical protein